MRKYDVAAYVWPAYGSKEPRARIFWNEGSGEWETVRNAKKLFDGHSWPRRPLWGYVDEANPDIMSMEIDVALRYGINVFIYDWYWYDNRPYLEQCLDDGFLKAKNCNGMKFYLMWANHNVTYGWDTRISTLDYDTYVWQGKVNSEQFRIIGKRWLDKYFCLDNYYKIDNKVVISIYDLQNFIDGLGGIESAQKEMKWLDNEVKKCGLDGVHYQLIKYGLVETNFSGFDTLKRKYEPSELVKYLPFSSLTHYQFAHITDINRDYNDVLKIVCNEWNSIDQSFDIPYMPHISVGWDNTPRYNTQIGNILKNNTPANFEKGLILAKKYADEHNSRLITLNSWNEWTETSYLQPDNIYGYSYLEAVEKVFKQC